MVPKKQSTRKTRTKLRKPKFLSLHLHLATTQPPMPTTTATAAGAADHSLQDNQLINFFPQHPENLMEQDNMAACIFSSCDDDGAATTLTGILCSDDDEDEENTNNPSPSSVNYADEEVKLVRTAIRGNKREINNRHEKWVSYSEVIRGMSSSSSSSTSCYNYNYNNDYDFDKRGSKLVLKLDYEKIMKTWVNKGPFCIRKNSDPGDPLPQTVPELQDDDFFFPSNNINGTTHDERDNGGSWTVPEMTHTENNDMCEGEDALQAVGSTAIIHNREASVQRYKEKRRNRLFAKTIRYEVRKLNAEKRPRIKGRFVKRN